MIKDKKVHKNSLYNFLPENRKGWIRIVEAFLSVLLVTVVLVLVVNQQRVQQDSSPKIYNYEIYVLRNIELNDTLRGEIISVANSALPSTSDNSTTFPSDVINQINAATPGSLVCGAKICYTNDSCSFWQLINKDIYAQRIFITSNLQNYSPKQLKLFCWPK